MGWIANLSNGETIKEEKPVEGQPSSWQKLLAYCKKNDVRLVNLRLTIGEYYVEAMPNKMCDGYFQAYEATRIMFRDTSSLKQGIGSIVGDKVFITWVSLQRDPSSGMYLTHQDIRPLSEVKIHTTLQ